MRNFHLSYILTEAIGGEGKLPGKGHEGISWGDGNLGGGYSGEYNSQNSPHPTVKMCAFCYT